MLFFDFDGTLTDVWPRYFQVFSAAAGTKAVALAQYVHEKKRLCKDDKVAAALGLSLPPDYYSVKRELLEAPEYLELDRLLVSSDQLLEFFGTHECRILTNRRKKKEFQRQLTQLGLGLLLDQSIVLNPDGGISKKEYIQENFPEPANVIIGDSQAESEAASLWNTRAVLVRTGLRVPEQLPFSERCAIVNDIAELLEKDMMGILS